MTTEHKNSRLSHVPAILAGSAAFIAAISTLYVNLRDKAPATPEPVATTQSTPVSDAAPAAVDAPAVTPSAPRMLMLRLDRVQVDNDGSMGSTDWTFQVSANDKPLFAVPMPSLNDKPGENLARPADLDAATAEIEMPPDKNVELSVSGWKKGWISGSKAEVSGKAWMAAGVNGTVITLASEKQGGPKFVLYFSVTPAEHQ